MCEAVFWGNWTELEWNAFPYVAYNFSPFFWLLNWNNSNTYQTRNFFFQIIIFKAFLRHLKQYVLECIEFYFSKINHVLLR